MKNRRNFYRILHVQHDAPLEVIKTSYKTIMQKLKAHPDLGGDLAKATLINEAYKTLSDPIKRQRYDNEFSPLVSNKALHTKQAAAKNQIQKQTEQELICGQCGKVNRFQANISIKKYCLKCRTPLDNMQQRDLQRIEQKGQIRFYVNSQPSPFTGYIVDLSPKGMRFITNMNLPERAKVKIECDLVHASGYIANCLQHHANKNLYSVGLQFKTSDFTESHGTFLSVST